MHSHCRLACLLFLSAVSSACLASGPATDGTSSAGRSERAYEVALLVRLAEPVLTAGSEGALKERVPKIEGARSQYAPLEALARTLVGIAPWLELGPGDDEEGRLRARYIGLATKAISLAVDPRSPGYLNFSEGGQPLVDTAFLALALLRAPRQLWGNLDAPTRANLVAALKGTRSIKPNESNWLLFSATVEAALLEFTGECERAPLEYAVKKHLEWYAGDGAYGDGPRFHWDYYNSFVIHPLLLEVLAVCERRKLDQGRHYALERTRAQRYAEVLERLISPEGTYPVIGRSSAYRFGAFHALSLLALRRELPPTIAPAAVRSALGAVLRRMAEAPGTFDAGGWLRVGAVGAQPQIAEAYINTGSLYLCTVGLLQLGLPADDPFWTAPDAAWTQKRIWSGEPAMPDHALKN